MRRPLPTSARFTGAAVVTLASLALLAAAAPGLAEDQHATPNLDAVAADLAERLAEVPTVPLKGKAKKCRKAFERGRAILANDTATRTADIKALKKVVGALNRWFKDVPELVPVAERSANEFRLELGETAGSILALVDDIQNQKDLKRIEKFLAKTDKALLKADGAKNTKQRVGQLEKASKQLDKAEQLAPKPEPPAGEVVDFVQYFADDPSGVRQCYALDVFADGSVADTPRQLSTGTTDVRSVRSYGTLAGGDGPCTYFLQDDDWYAFELDEAVATEGTEAVNLTEDVPPLGDGDYFLSPSRNYAFVFTDDSDGYLLHIDLDAVGVVVDATDTGLDGDAAFWCDDEFCCAITSSEQEPFFGGRIDVCLLDEEGELTCESVAGPSVNATSGLDVSISPDGRFVAYSCTLEFAPGTRLCIWDSQTGEYVEVFDSIVALDSDPDFRISRRIACTWATPTKCFFDGVPAFQHATHDENASELSFALEVVDPNGSNYTVCASNADDVVLIDNFDREIVHADCTTDTVTYLGDEDNFDPACIYLPGARTIIYSNSPADKPDEVRVFQPDIREDTLAAIVDSNPANAPTTFIRNFRVGDGVSFPGTSGLSILFNVVTNNDDVGGTYALALEGVASPNPQIVGPKRVLEQGDEESVDDLGVLIEFGLDDEEPGALGIFGLVRNFALGTTTLRGVRAEPDGIIIPLFSIPAQGFTLWFR